VKCGNRVSNARSNVNLGSLPRLADAARISNGRYQSVYSEMVKEFIMKVGKSESQRVYLKRRAAIVAIAVANLGASALAADTTWTGPGAGTWNVAGNWNNGAPTAGNNTFVDGGAAGNTTVTVTASATTGTLHISAGDVVSVNNAASLSLNGSGTSSLLSNAGEVIINGTTAGRLRFINSASGVDAQITGGGTITLSGLAILDGTTAVRVVNNDNYIHGTGNIGNNSITFDNHATIAADVNAGTLSVDPNGGSGTFSFMRNTGVMRATGGGILDLVGFNGGTFNNTGTIEAQNNSTVRYRLGASVTGGTLTSSGTGAHRVTAGNDGFFNSITNTGLMVAENNAAMNINTAITNNGTMSVEAGASYTALRLNGHTDVSGTGVIQLNGQLANIDGAAGARLTLGAGQTLRGAGFVGREVLTVTNNGLIVADINGDVLNLDPDGNSGAFSFLENNGTLRATGGGILELDGFNGGTHSNANGTIEALNNSTVRLKNGAFVSGGTLATSGNGSLSVLTGHTGFFGGGVTNSGLMVAPNQTTIGLVTAMTNNGTIRVEAGANQTLFNINDNATLSGTGQLILSGQNAGISGPDDRRLTNAAGHTIRGEGKIGFNTIWFDNKGLINADVSGGTLDLTADGTAGADAFINSGTLRASNGGILLLNGAEGGFNNTGGLIEAQAGSQVRFINFADVRGGTLNSVGTGRLRINEGQNEGFTDVTNNGILIAENGSSVGTASTFVNNGTVSIEAGANFTGVYAYTPTLISGTGQIVLTGANAYLHGANDQRITNAAGHTIRGQGSIGGTEPWVTNEGLIVADVPGGTMTLAADGTAGQNAFINTGTIRAANGGLINFGPSEGGFNGTGGTVEAQNGSTVRFFNASILGGTFVSAGSGEFRVPSGFAVAFNDNSLSGTMIAENNSNIQTFGPIVNNGTILLDSGVNVAFLNVRAPTLLSGNGTLIMSGTTAFVGGLNDQRLTNDVNHTIRGRGTVGGSEIWVTNNGTILSDVNGGSIVLAGDGTAGQNAVINDGTIRATNGGLVQFGPSEGGVNGLGTLTADDNSTIQSTSGLFVFQGPVNGAGTFAALGGSNFTGSHFRVTNLVVNGATANVRAGGGTLGTSKVSSLSLVGTARLNLTNHDLAVDYTGSSVFDTIRAAIITGYNNGNWNGVGINSSAAQASTSPKTALGYAEASQILGPGGGMFSGVAVDGTTVLVKYTIAGDANLSGNVNLDDFTALAANFGNAGVWTTGDFNYNGLVNLDDFTILASSFGQSLPADVARGAAVPEPAGAVVLLVAGAAMARRRRR